MCLSFYSPPTCMMMSSGDIICSAISFIANLRLYVHVHIKCGTLFVVHAA